MYAVVVIVVMCFHEPWFDEAQSWLIARDCSWHDLLLVRPHYEGHPPLWWLLLAIPARLGVPYEWGIKSIQLVTAVFFVWVAVPIYLNQRKSAWRSSVQDDVQQRPGDHRHRHAKLKDGEKLTMKTNDSSTTCSDKECTFTQAGGTISGTPVTVSKDNTIKVTINYGKANGGDYYTIEGGNSSLGDFEYKYESTTGALEWHPHRP